MRALGVRLAVLVALAAPAAGAAQGPGTGSGVVRGTVVDAATGERLAAALVRIPQLHRGEQSHDDGGFVLAGLSPGRHELVVQRIGYRARILAVDVRAGDTTIVEVRLTAAALELPATVVTGTLRERTGDQVLSPTSVLSGAELDGRLDGTVAATLQDEPGVAVGSLGPTTGRPVIRGLGGDRILVLEDGARTGDFSSLSADHAVAVDPLTAERIEVVRGPMSLIYGSSALGGVVNVIREEIPTSVPEHSHGVVSAQGSSVNRGGTGSAVLHTRLAGLGARLEGTGRGSGDVRTPDGRLINTDSRLFGAAAALGKAGKWGHGGVVYRFLLNDYGIPGGFVGGHPQGVDIRTRRHSLRGELERHRHGAVWSTLRITAGATDYRLEEIESGGSLGTLFDQELVQAGADVLHEASGPFALGAVGVRVQYRDILTGGSLRTPSTYDYTVGGFVVEEVGRGRLRAQIGLRYDWARYVPRDSASISVGGQRIPVRPRDFGAFSGALGFLYTTVPGLTVGVSGARAFRTPDFNELYSDGPHLAANSYDVGDPSLKAETGYGLDAFARLSTSRIEGQAAVFVNRLTDYIFPSSRGRAELGTQGQRPRFQHTNEDARFIGAEASAAVSLTAQLVLEGTVSHVVARFTSTRDSIPIITPVDTTWVPPSPYPPFIPPLHGRIGLRLERSRWFAGAGVRIAAAQERLGDFETRTGGYAVGDLQAGYRLLAGGRLHSVALRVDNVGDRAYRDHLSRVKDIMPAPGRNVSLLYRLTF
jgi:iron complex outermembrane receptor protein